VRSHITTPENDVGLNFFVDNFSHCGNNIKRNIAAEGAERTGLESGIRGETI
jgi:hypothetical protein